MLNVLASGDLTARSLRSTVYHVLRSPDAHAKLVKELDGETSIGMPAQWN